MTAATHKDGLQKCIAHFVSPEHITQEIAMRSEGLLQTGADTVISGKDNLDHKLVMIILSTVEMTAVFQVLLIDFHSGRSTIDPVPNRDKRSSNRFGRRRTHSTTGVNRSTHGRLASLTDRAVRRSTRWGGLRLYVFLDSAADQWCRADDVDERTATASNSIYA